MSLATINGFAVTEGRLTFALEGAATAELKTQADDATTLNGSAVLEVGGVTLVGTATAEADAAGIISVIWTAGAGGLGTATKPQHYKPPVTRRRVLLDALGIGKEILSPLADAAILDAPLTQWTRVAGTVKSALRTLVKQAGAAWRLLPDGTVWIGRETWPPLGLDLTIESEERDRETFTVAVDALTVFPGVTFNEKRITQVEYSLDGSKLRARLSYGTGKSSIRALVREEMADQEYAAPWVAKVVGQNGDETLELKSTNERFPDMSQVPIRPGMLGLVSTKLTPVPPITAIVEFENADPSKPAVTGWYAGSARELVFDAQILIKLGQLAQAFAARADFVDANFQKLLATLNSGANSGGPVTFAVPFTPQPVGATKVQVE